MMDWEKQEAMREQLEEWFENHNDAEFLKFDRIPENERKHHRADLCAMLYISERFNGNADIVCSAAHDQIWLEGAKEADWTEADVIYLSRCGVLLDEDSFSMFV